MTVKLSASFYLVELVQTTVYHEYIRILKKTLSDHLKIFLTFFVFEIFSNNQKCLEELVQELRFLKDLVMNSFTGGWQVLRKSKIRFWTKKLIPLSGSIFLRHIIYSLKLLYQLLEIHHMPQAQVLVRSLNHSLSKFQLDRLHIHCPSQTAMEMSKYTKNLAAYYGVRNWKLPYIHIIYYI